MKAGLKKVKAGVNGSYEILNQEVCLRQKRIEVLKTSSAQTAKITKLGYEFKAVPVKNKH